MYSLTSFLLGIGVDNGNTFHWHIECDGSSAGLSYEMKDRRLWEWVTLLREILGSLLVAETIRSTFISLQPIRAGIQIRFCCW